VCAHSGDDAQHELKGEKKVVEEGEKRRRRRKRGRESLRPTLNVVLSQGQPYTQERLYKNRIKNRLQRALSLESENSFTKDAFF